MWSVKCFPRVCLFSASGSGRSSPRQHFCTFILCASRNFPLSLSHSMLAPGLRSSTLFSLFPSFSVRSFPCFCTSQSLYFLRIRFPSVDFLYNSYALFVCLRLLVIATCLQSVSLVCWLHLHVQCSLRFSVVCLLVVARGVGFCVPVFLVELPVSCFVCIFLFLIGCSGGAVPLCCTGFLRLPPCSCPSARCRLPSCCAPCLSLLFCLPSLSPTVLQSVFPTCVSPLQCAPLCCASLQCCFCILPVFFSPPFCFNSPLCPYVFVCRSTCVLHLPPLVSCLFPSVSHLPAVLPLPSSFSCLLFALPFFRFSWFVRISCVCFRFRLFPFYVSPLLSVSPLLLRSASMFVASLLPVSPLLFVQTQLHDLPLI